MVVIILKTKVFVLRCVIPVVLSQQYNVYNYVYIHLYMQSKTQQFVRWYHYVICNIM